MTVAVRPRPGARVALVVLTLGAVFTARPPGEGAVLRVAYAVFVLASAALVVWLARRDDLSRGVVMGLAVAFRLVAFPLPPALSDDVYRYVWDGMVQARLHENPYRYHPSDPALSGGHGEQVYDRLNSRDYYAVYPPVSQLVFRVGGYVYGWGWRASYYLIKLFVTAAEVGGIWLLLRLAPPAAVVLYAWHPLAVLEVAGQGHGEGLAVGALALALWALERRRGGLAGAGVALAGWVKLTPLLLLPLVARRAGLRSVLVGALVLAGTALPFAAPYVIPHVRESLGLYVRLFEFGAGPYYALKGLAHAAGMGDVSKALGPLLAGVFFLGAAALVIRDARRRPSFAASASALLGWFFACATTVHPWYLLIGLALAPLLRAPGPWVWAASVAPATYLVYTGQEGVYAGTVAVAWIGAGVLIVFPYRRRLLDALLRRRARWKWAWMAPHLRALGPGSDVLDLGAGEGFVGETVARTTGARVVLADVADLNRTGLPFVRLDGPALPFADDTFDAVLLVFVLHHAKDPERLLAEAARVCRGDLVVVESVPDPRARWLTEGLDRLANRLRGPALRAQEPWLRMRPAAAWREVFAAAGLAVAGEARRGRGLHPQALFVLRPPVIANRRTHTQGAAETM